MISFLFQIAHEKAKKNEGKKSRDDKDQVMEMLFALFEKHQASSFIWSQLVLITYTLQSKESRERSPRTDTLYYDNQNNHNS